MTDDSRKKVHLQGRIKDSVNAAIIHILDREYPCWNTRSAGYTNEVQAVINSSTVVVTHIYDEVKNAVQPGWLQIEDLGW
jgi:putative N-acetylmannosamine-6-phosphate epimerase